MDSPRRPQTASTRPLTGDTSITAADLTPQHSLSSQSSVRKASFSLPNSSSGSRLELEDDRASSNASDLWPRSEDDSDDGSEAPKPTTLVRRHTAAKQSGSSMARFFRSVRQRLGRSYNKAYDLLPVDQQERDRNELQHNIIKELLDGRLYLAPISRPRRVLDLGTGPGIWALEVARENPSAAVIGIDINRVQPPYRLPNCSFTTMDMMQPSWPTSSITEQPFDLIHLRLLSRLPPRKTIETIFQHLSPGGWAEFTEWITLSQSPNHSSDGTAWQLWNNLLAKGFEKTGKPADFPLQYEQMLTGVGFERATVRKYACPINSWAPGKKQKRVGGMMATNVINFVNAVSPPILVGVLGWGEEEMERLLVRVRGELVDERIHMFLTLHVIFAQKPRAASSAASSIRQLSATTSRT